MVTAARKLRVASVQMEHQDGKQEANFAKIEGFVAQAAAQGAQLVVFPECCVCGYWFIRNLSIDELAALAEPIPEGPSTQRLRELAQRYRITVGAGWIESTASGAFHNTYVVALPDGTIHRHRKLQSFEHSAIRSGDSYTVFDLPEGFRAAILICYDNNIIENVRMTALAGADVLLAPHQTGGVGGKDPHRMGLIDPALWANRLADPASIEREFRGDKGRGWLMRWLPSRAHDNGLFLVFSNGVGVDDDEIRTGNAMILDPYGRILAETHQAADAMVTADLDASLLETATGRRWIRARRPELYGALTVRTGHERDTRELKFQK
ncbi:MAG: acyltransferase [Gammaproteobacteria bacterium]|nr:acyltransferase [Gammaproteobacteria bacterium]